jgi:peptidyl-prolyl cis-trans isomerase SurA
LPDTFAKAMDSLQVKAISNPVRTPSGWHLIQVLERKTVNDSKRLQHQQARQMLFNQRMQIATQNWVKSLRGQAYINIVKNA